uniref:hypothetical protein n=1 Tax=Candidatus Phytoplasma sp. AldY-WA1 TaxID=2852100 RepID=UPI00254C4702
KKFTHMRFVTKNLEAEFDSVYFGLNAVSNWIPYLKDDYKEFFNDEYVQYLENNISNETLLKKVNEFNNKYESSKIYVFGINLELEEKEIFYNKTNQIEKRYVIKKDYLKKNFEYLTWAFKNEINNDDFKNFINLNKNFESRTLSDTKQPEDCLM